MCTEHITSYNIEEHVRNEASKILSYIMNIPVQDATKSALLCPLFLAGGEVLTEAEIELVRKRLRGRYRKKRFRNILRTLHTLKSLCALRQSDTDNDNVFLDW
jgi:hypothetical protein